MECQRDLLFEILTRPGHSVTDIRRTVKAGHWVVSTQIARSREGIEVQADSNTGMSGLLQSSVLFDLGFIVHKLRLLRLPAALCLCGPFRSSFRLQSQP
jgi:hypothetical protein